ncbi:uncharacterized protein LOC131324657 isoform X1 [Rhododendron vialii]|uniref:uncharacterized protein LOC131324657 isoform X1 n=1 Tax=Rhododendron vialii TaxID=182163 RepID=UPI0026605164|nr:uncharacterized protein LOC131324657 isoform X1 [Rhododendron vialii]
MDNCSIGAGFMAVFAVSGSVVLLAHQLHKRLLSDFMKKMEFELVASHKCHSKKVRFSEEIVVLELSSKNKWYLEKHPSKLADQNSITSLTAEKELGSMPLNRQVLYKGILKYRTNKGIRKNMISN